MAFLDLPAIKREISLQMVLDHVGWKARTTKEGEKRGLCPLHNSTNKKSRSFAVKEDGFYCHSCKANGDQIEFWMHYYRLPLMDAVHAMCEAFGVPEYRKPIPRRHAAPGNGEEER